MRRVVTPLLLCMMVMMLACTGSNTGGSGNQGSQGGGRESGQYSLRSGDPFMECPQQTNTRVAPPEQGKVTLTVAYWSSSPVEDALVEANLQQFQRLHPNILIKKELIRGDYSSALQADLKRGQMPDVFYLQPRMANIYIGQGVLLNLSPYMARDKVAATDFYPGLISSFSCKGGQVYGLPKDWNALGVFYNKRLFAAAHLPEPGPNWTWQDLRTTAQKLTSVDAQGRAQTYGLTLQLDSSRWLAFLLANGGSVLSPDGTRTTFNSKAGVEAMDYYTSFMRQDASSTLSTSLVPATAQEEFDAFGMGHSAMVIEGGWLVTYMQQNYPQTDYGIAPLPKGPGGKQANLIYTNAWAASAQSKHPEASWELIHYMTGQDVQRSQLQAGFALPTLKNMNINAYLQAHPKINVLFEGANYGYLDNFGKYDQYIHDRLNLAIQSVLFSQTSSQAALDRAAMQVNQILSP